MSQSSKWQKGFVRVAIPSENHGDFAVHQAVHDFGMFSVSHTPTGLCAGSFSSHETAMDYAELLVTFPGWDRVKTGPDGRCHDMPEDLARKCRDAYAKLTGCPL